MVKDTSINSILLTMPLRNGKSDCKHIGELKTDLLVVNMTLLFCRFMKLHVLRKD